MEGWSDKSLKDLLKEAQMVFIKREEEKQKQKAKMMVSTVDQVVKKRIETAPQRGKGKWIRGSGMRGGRGGNLGCGHLWQSPRTTLQVGSFHRGKDGDFKRECPLN